MNKTIDLTFEELLKQNERRIYYYIHKLNIYDQHKEFYQEGLCALWSAYQTYQPDKGPLATYFNFIIRNRLIDLLRKKTTELEKDKKLLQEKTKQHNNGNYILKNETYYPILDPNTLLYDPYQWRQIKSRLTQNQWKWVYFHVIGDMSLEDIAIQENTTIDAVKNWGRYVRKKLKDEKFRKDPLDLN